MRNKIWDSYIKRRINYHDEHDFLSEHNPEYQEIVRKFRNQDLFQESDDETQKTIGQIILWTKAKENGWQSYRELLNIVRKNFSVEFWLSGEDKEKTDDIVNYRRRRSDGSISGSQSSWLTSELQGLEIYYKDSLNFFAGMNPEDAKSVIVKKEESYIGFYIGSQKIFDTNPNIRRDLSQISGRRRTQFS